MNTKPKPLVNDHETLFIVNAEENREGFGAFWHPIAYEDYNANNPSHLIIVRGTHTFCFQEILQ